MPFLIRPSTIADTDILGRVTAQAWQETYAAILSSETLAQVASVERRTEIRRKIFAASTPNSAHFLVEDEQGRVVGFADCGETTSFTEFAPCEITTLYLLREAQGHGLGKELLLRMLTHLADRGFTCVALDVFAANEKAARFYRQMGAKEVKRVQSDFAGTLVPMIVFTWSDLNRFASTKQ